jgi:cyclomaltodextrinase / maltogenic alpha-amylase / neopullulanase
MNRLQLIAGLALFLTMMMISSCKNNEDFPVAKERQMVGMAAPIRLQTDSTVIELKDYFLDPRKIDSVQIVGSLKSSISGDSSKLIIVTGTKTIPFLSLMTVWVKGYSYSFLLERSPRMWKRITFNPKKKIFKKVQIAGEMNNWNPSHTFLTFKDSAWTTDLFLNPGKYQYQLVLDGKWTLDPGNPEKVDNNIGGYNSLLHVGNISPSGLPFLFTNKTEKNKITIGVKNKMTRYFVFWQNGLLGEQFQKADSSGITIVIPRKARQFERSYIRVWAYNQSGSSNQLLIPLVNGEVLLKPSEIKRSDKEAMILYFLMVDRFCDGDTSNDRPVIDKDVDPRVNFQGGDLRGIQKKIEEGYFTDLGVNTLWISPITQNPPDAWTEYPAPHRKFTGYHGYWPVTLSTVDNRFGRDSDLKNMVGEAHDRNMNVLLDYVSNHVHKESEIYKKHPEWATPFILPDKRKNIRLWDEQRLTTWFDEFLPTLDLSNPEVCNMMSDSALFWIKEYKLDGFRHDATKHIPEIYWRTLTRKIIEQVEIPEDRSVYQIGETYGSRDLISSYINPGLLDAQFDFDLYFNARTIFTKDNSSFKDLNYVLQETFNYYGEHSLMGNISGNQDQTRFISLASGALKFGEDDREAGWKRDIEVMDTSGYDKLTTFLAFNLTIPGIPVIYYGDEFGMPGANDPDNRRMMKFDHLTAREARTKGIVQQLTRLRNENLCFIYGDLSPLLVSDDLYVYMRSYFTNVAFVIFNKDKTSKKIEFEIPERFDKVQLKTTFGNNFKVDRNRISVTLKPNTFEILTN